MPARAARPRAALCRCVLAGAAFAGTLVASETSAAGRFPREIAPGVFEVGPASVDAGGIVTHTIRSPFQGGENAVHVLLPAAARQPGRKFRVLYVLPVYGGVEAARAGLAEVLRTGLHERHGLICVSPAFATIPWYADHPTDPLIRQESHLLRAVLPLVERCHPARADAAGRLLLGFSKSGWGAWSLLLRHPEVFGAAASWDAPLAMPGPGPWQTDRIWPTAADFARYAIGDLLRQRAELLRWQPARLVLMGHGKFPDDDIAVHELMARLGIPHHWEHGRRLEHGWTSGWVAPAVNALMSLSDSSQSRETL
jgi:hypothetical protein